VAAFPFSILKCEVASWLQKSFSVARKRALHRIAGTMAMVSSIRCRGKAD
jgi:hypothetical protein